MACFHTMTAYRLRNGELSFKKKGEILETLQLPCGKCIGCRLDHANDWATRCYCEMKTWKNNCFITLTYNDENLPENGLLCKKDVQDFMKRLRYYHEGIEEWENPRTGKKEKPIRFLLCGEYGPNGSRRPHYHILIFNWKPEKTKFYKENYNGNRILECKEIQKIWGKGFITVGELTYQSACYVARYCTKKMFNGLKVRDLKKAEIQPEFILMSRNGGIGIKYWNEYKKSILQKGGILINQNGKVKIKRIPRYFEKKLQESMSELEFEKYKKRKQIKGIAEFKKILEKTSKTESEYKAMQEEILKENTKILRRDNIR